MKRNRISFARWSSDLPSGGNRYDSELTAGLRAQGIEVQECPITGSWPFPDPRDRARFHKLLLTADAADRTAHGIVHDSDADADADADSDSDTGTGTESAPVQPGDPAQRGDPPSGAGRHWLIGNIVGAAAPETIRAATAAGHRVTMVMHYFAADDETLAQADRDRIAASEGEAVAAANTIIATSAWTANEVSKRYGRGDAVVAVPGVETAEIAPGALGDGRPPMLLWLGSVTPLKDPLTLVNALSMLRDLDWNARIVGPDTLDPKLSRDVRARIADVGLEHRLQVLGAREGERLETLWRDTDLLVHTSRSEAYGMVISEALAHSIPSIVTQGTGAVEAQQGTGDSFPAGDPRALAAALRIWMSDAQLRTNWRATAAERRAALPTWADTARAIAQALR